MESISPSELALELLNHCLRGQDWPRDVLDSLLELATDPDPLVEAEAGHALFAVLVEGLADLFEPSLALAYAEIFSQAVQFVHPELEADELLARYRRIRQPRRFEGDPGRVRQVFVLSRVTLGADVAVTSVFLDAAKKRFPNARIALVGPRKAWELFQADPRIQHVEVPYTRSGSLRHRLAAWPRLRKLLSQRSSITLDPDSRLTQLGLLPAAPDEDYYFFESRAWQAESQAPLSALARDWVRETLGVEETAPYIRPLPPPLAGERPMLTLSLGVGDNPAKRIPDPFEQDLVRGLLREGQLLVIDKGAGGEEARRVECAVARAGAKAGQVRLWDGAFAPFAALIARSRLYVGYDSAGQHVAAACGVPLVSVFAGFPSFKMFSRWRPSGPGPIEVVRVDQPDPQRVLVDTLAAAYRLGA